MNKEATELLKGLAETMGTTTEYLWLVLLKQAPIQGALNIIEYLIGGLLLFGSYKIACLAHKLVQEDNWDESAYVWLIIPGVISIYLLIAMVIQFDHLVTPFLNPEYWALNKILSLL